MTSPISSIAASLHTAATAAAPAAKSSAGPASEKAASPAPSTTVTVSSAAKAALEESTETLAQTQQEARGHDIQAQRLLAKLALTKG